MLALQIALGFGIAMLMPLLVYYLTCSIFPRPEWPLKTATGTPDKSANKAREEALEQHRLKTNQFQKRLFYIACSIGFCALATGPFLAVKAVGTGLMFGGVFSIIEGVGCCWANLNPKAKFAFLLSTLVVLIVIGYHNFAG